MKRVVITGIGAITPLADNFHDSWMLIKNGNSGIDRITKFDTSNLKWRMGGEIKKFNPGQYLSPKEILRLDPFVHYSTSAAIMAVTDAGLISRKPEAGSQTSSLLRSGGVIIGSSRGGITTIEKEFQKLLGLQVIHHGSRMSPHLMPATTISMAASHIAQKLGIIGHCLGISNACASGTNAIGEAFRMIKYGQADLILAGGTEAPLCRFCIEGYGISGALSENGSRPFDSNRDGFVIAEGACVLVLEEHSSALKRNAKIYGELIGYSSTSDAYHMTKPDANGETRAIRAALDDAGISPGNVDYINAHATSTFIGDRAESAAIINVFSGHLNVHVSSIKSMTGHMLAASGAFETACTVMSIKEGTIPPTINLYEKDPFCDINVATEKTMTPIDVAISNSFGFGGVNAVLVLKKAEEQGD